MQLTPTCCIGKTILGGIYELLYCYSVSEGKDTATANTIRKRITEVCSGEREKVKIPLRWHTLDHRSRKISDSLKRKVLSREEYGEIAKSLNIDHKSCEGALNFFSGLNTIFYFPKALPNLVFLDPQILLDKWQRATE